MLGLNIGLMIMFIDAVQHFPEPFPTGSNPPRTEFNQRIFTTKGPFPPEGSALLRQLLNGGTALFAF